MTKNEFVQVAKVNEIPDGKMKHVEVDGKEVLVANVSGKYFAISDRCGHMNALLSMGNLRGSTVTCPFHGSTFDITTRKEAFRTYLNAFPGNGTATANVAKIFRKRRSTYGSYQDI